MEPKATVTILSRDGSKREVKAPPGGIVPLRRGERVTKIELDRARLTEYDCR